MNFIGSVAPPQNIDENAWWFIFKKDELLVINNSEKLEPLSKSNLQEIEKDLSDIQYLGTLENRQCFTAEFIGESEIPGEIYLKSLRPLLMAWDDALFTLAGRAYQLIDWDRNHKYCGRCGTKTETKFGENAKTCPNCGLICYPRISPAIIAAVIKDDKILLAHSGRFRNKMYSVLAGFLEPGETFEECVKREIFEEVNIKVKNIKYFGSQPWPFPNSIMIGFTAEYESGEIKVDNKEIIDADWYGPNELPEIPGKWSIARKLIDWYIEKYKI